ncbi:hypothetical protein EYF80_033481 [Liparis tanakae]|uniref:Uncharacterized protein n=1 Tax=Liparis tanakae TaxID=230148 RepID=A0A4Z2GT43_9TELE|nr:hypothetical protein EYF80_033481 [Liparis tanakae]
MRERRELIGGEEGGWDSVLRLSAGTEHLPVDSFLLTCERTVQSVELQRAPAGDGLLLLPDRAAGGSEGRSEELRYEVLTSIEAVPRHEGAVGQRAAAGTARPQQVAQASDVERSQLHRTAGQDRQLRREEGNNLHREDGHLRRGPTRLPHTGEVSARSPRGIGPLSATSTALASKSHLVLQYA